METLTKKSFSDLDGEQKLSAVSQMYYFKKKHDWPAGAVWDNEDDVTADLEQGYDAGDHFSFYINSEDDDVVVKTV